MYPSKERPPYPPEFPTDKKKLSAVDMEELLATTHEVLDTVKQITPVLQDIGKMLKQMK